MSIAVDAVPDEAAEFRDDAGRACRLCAPGLYGINLDGQAIALLHAADGNRATLRIEKWKLQFCGGAVPFAGDDAAEGIFRFHHDDIARADSEYRLGIGPIDIVEVALRLDGELVTFAGLALGKAALRHDRAPEPGIVDHRDTLKSSNDGGGADQ